MNNAHHFKINLPLLPHEALREDTNPAIAIEMDGKKLEGATGVNVRAGFNGYTNVAIELITNAAIEMVAALLVDLKEGIASERQALFAAIYDDAHREVIRELEYDGLELTDQPAAKAKIMVNLIEQLAALNLNKEQA